MIRLRDRAFFALWTLKESFVKREGTGIAGGLGSFSVTLAGGAPALAAPPGRSAAFRQWFSGEYVLAACSDLEASRAERHRDRFGFGMKAHQRRDPPAEPGRRADEDETTGRWIRR